MWGWQAGAGCGSNLPGVRSDRDPDRDQLAADGRGLDGGPGRGALAGALGGAA